MRTPALARGAAAGRPPAGRRSAAPWGSAVVGALCGLVAAVLWFAPASWLASAVLKISDGRLVLAGSQGTVWNGSAQLVLSGGAGSRDAAALPGRLSWQLRPGWRGLHVRIDAACCTPQGLVLEALPSWGGVSLRLSDGQSNWPASLLSGLGTPWNTVQPEGELRLSSQGMAVDIVQGRVSVAGKAQIEARRMSSRLSTLKPMGSYRVSITGGAVTTLGLETLEGALRLSGNGQWAGARLRFEGLASAEPGSETALSNLLNIIGRRDGARSIITVG